jgi:hypothetical protein
MRAGRVVAAGPGRADTGEKKGGEGWGGEMGMGISKNEMLTWILEMPNWKVMPNKVPSIEP